MRWCKKKKITRLDPENTLNLQGRNLHSKHLKRKIETKMVTTYDCELMILFLQFRGYYKNLNKPLV